MQNLLILLAVYQLKHFLADFPLQTEYMLGKFKNGWGFLLPLGAHAGTHASMTLGIAYVFSRSLPLSASLAMFDLLTHFSMDRVKASGEYLGRFKALSAKEFPMATKMERQQNNFFWWSLGFDQMFHHLSHYAIIACLLSQS